jgi:hypothetical protein
MGETKVCSSCHKEKTLNEFRKNLHNIGGLSGKCAACWRAYERADYTKNRERKNALRKKRDYNLAPEAHKALLIAQENLCAICKRPAALAARGVLYVDHDHVTKEVRGLLCSDCNSMIGFAKDNTQVLALAITYLNRFKH